MRPALYDLPSLKDVHNAAQLISDMVIKTPIKSCPRLTDTINRSPHQPGTRNPDSIVQLLLKCENLQHTGSFKFRGAYHFLSKRSDAELKHGVVTYSTGNHAQAVAHATHLTSLTRTLPIPTTVILPSSCPPTKISASKSHGANVLLSGPDPTARVTLAEQIHHATGALLIPPADHRDIVLGQATAIQEFLEQASEAGTPLDAIVVPSGGGGLLCGAIAACRGRGVAVFGAEPGVGGPGLGIALKTGRRTVAISGKGSMADGLRSLTGEANWEHIKAEGNVQGVWGVSEGEIREALRGVVGELGVGIEPSAAVAVAAVMFGKGFREWVGGREGRVTVGVVVTGGNVSSEDLLEIMYGEGSEEVGSGCV